MESKNSVTVRSRGSALKDGQGHEEQIELELGLSIGGSYKRAAQKCVCVTNGDDSKSESNGAPGYTTIGSESSGFMGIDPIKKCEIHALRRHEAKKKREARQLKRGLLSRWKDDEMVSLKRNEGDFDEPDSKTTKTGDAGSGQDHVKNLNQSFSFAVQYQYPHQPLRQGPATNGFVHPCGNGNMMPCWLTGGVGNKERNVIQPVARYCSGPLQASSDSGYNLGNSFETGHNGSRDGGNRKSGSNGSSLCTSSACSDYRSTSNEGGGSYETISHSSHSVADHPPLNQSKTKDANCQSGYSATSHFKESALEAADHVEKLIPSNSAQSCPIRPREEVKSETEKVTDPTDKRMPATESPFSGPPNESTGNMGKPPKPQIQNQNTIPLPYMPCVSTTGNGPNGKTINGFLYRYTKTEVSIICVCHGASFSPAEFVQHAGGIDVSHPLRHITVIPSVS